MFITKLILDSVFCVFGKISTNLVLQKLNLPHTKEVFSTKLYHVILRK